MADFKWIKIVTDIFDDEKMLLIDGLPERDGIIVIWFKLLCMAGKQNNGGVFMLNDKIAYTDEMLSTIFRRPLNTVRLALKTFEQFGMIEIVNETITIPNWEKHQSTEQMEKQKEATRKRVAAYRERQKMLATGCNEKSNVTVTLRNDTEEDTEEDKEKEEDKDKRKSIDYQAIVNAFKEICISLPTIRILTDSRKRSIKARINDGYTYDDFITLFQKTQASDFLKGINDRSWSADFDWLLKETNMAKVLEGRYDNKGGVNGGSTTTNSTQSGGSEWSRFEHDKFCI